MSVIINVVTIVTVISANIMFMFLVMCFHDHYFLVGFSISSFMSCLLLLAGRPVCYNAICKTMCIIYRYIDICIYK